MFPSHKDDGAGFFCPVSHILLSVSSASCSLRAFELSAVISTGTTGKTLLHCVSLIEVRQLCPRTIGQGLNPN